MRSTWTIEVKYCNFLLNPALTWSSYLFHILLCCLMHSCHSCHADFASVGKVFCFRRILAFILCFIAGLLSSDVKVKQSIIEILAVEAKIHEDGLQYVMEALNDFKVNLILPVEFFANTESWQYWHYCQLCISSFLLYLHQLMQVNEFLMAELKQSWQC